MQLDAYFDRIGYRGPRTPNAETLHAITRAHTQSIPFENLNPLLNVPVPIEAEALFEKLVHQRRGGYCFEQNGLLLSVLAQLGYEVRPLRAGTRFVQTDRRLPVGHTHLVVEVRIGHELWISDVGVGSHSLTRALRFALDEPQDTPHDERRFVREGAQYYHQMRQGDRWVDLYEFGGEAMHETDREIANWYTSAHPQSRFRHNLIVARALPSGQRISLNNAVFKERDAQGHAVERPVADLPSLMQILQERFRLNFEPDAAQRARLTQVLWPEGG